MSGPYNSRAWGSGPKPAGWVSLPWPEKFTRCPVHDCYVKYKDAYRPSPVPYWVSYSGCLCPTEKKDAS